MKAVIVLHKSMSNRTKKIIWGIVIVLLLAAAAFAVWWFFFRTTTSITPPTTSGTFPESGKLGDIEAPSDDDGEEFGFGTETGEGPSLRQLTTEPVAGAVIFSRGGETVVRWAERGTGHFFEESVTANSPTRISNQTIPEIGDVIWRPDGNGVIVRYEKNSAGTSYIESFYAPVNASAKEGDTLRASFLPRNIKTIAFSPTGNTIFYLSENSAGSTATLAAPDGTKKSSLIELPIKDLSVNWPVNDSVFLTTRAAAGIGGVVFSLGSQNGLFDAVGQGFGLTTIANRTGSLILKSKNGALSVARRSEGTETSVGLTTIADKCVWGKKDKTEAYCAVPQSSSQEDLLDNWYQGTITTRDSLWSINGEDVETNLLTSFNDARENIDAFNLDISADDKYIIFQNKDDLTLWLLRL